MHSHALTLHSRSGSTWQAPSSCCTCNARLADANFVLGILCMLLQVKATTGCELCAFKSILLMHYWLRTLPQKNSQQLELRTLPQKNSQQLETSTSPDHRRTHQGRLRHCLTHGAARRLRVSWPELSSCHVLPSREIRRPPLSASRSWTRTFPAGPASALPHGPARLASYLDGTTRVVTHPSPPCQRSSTPTPTQPPHPPLPAPFPTPFPTPPDTQLLLKGSPWRCTCPRLVGGSGVSL